MASRGDNNTKPNITLETAAFHEAEVARSTQLEERARKKQIDKENRAMVRQATELRDQCPPAAQDPLHRAEADAAMATAETRLGVSTAEQVSDIRSAPETPLVGTFRKATLEAAWRHLYRTELAARTAVKTKMPSCSKKGTLCSDESAEMHALYATHQRQDTEMSSSSRHESAQYTFVLEVDGKAAGEVVLENDAHWNEFCKAVHVKLGFDVDQVEYEDTFGLGYWCKEEDRWRDLLKMMKEDQFIKLTLRIPSNKAATAAGKKEIIQKF